MTDKHNSAGFPDPRLFANERCLSGADDMPDPQLSLNRKIPRAVAGL